MAEALLNYLLCQLYEFEIENYCQWAWLQVTEIESMNGMN
jgi:hypothetical protein